MKGKGKERSIINYSARVPSYLILFFIFFLFLSPIEAREIFPLEQVEKGLLGVGKTVFSGQKVETFPVEVLGVVKNQAPVEHLILIQLLGEDRERGGGIAAGMSGSPIYVDEKLLGAIGYGWTFTDHRLGLVTPIGDMLALWEEEPDLLLFDQYPNYEEIIIDIEGLAGYGIIPVKTPLLVSGVGKRGLQLLGESLSDFQVYPVFGGGLKGDEGSGDLEPGSAIAIQLARGDVNVSAIGTVTHREGNRILAFGHPFLYRGGSGYLISGAYIHRLITNQSMPFKLGSPTQLKGTLVVDRMAGIAGELYRYPPVVPLRISVLDKDRDQLSRTNVQLVKDEDFLLALSMVSALEAIDRAVDRIGRGTAHVRLELTAHSLPQKVLTRENIFNSQLDIASVAIMELGQILSLLSYNPFKDVDFIDMKVQIEVTQELHMATIKEMNVLNGEVYPGDTLEIQVILQPYRQKEEELIVLIDLPEDMNTGTATLSLLSGFEVGYEQGYYEENGEVSGHAITSDFKDLEEMLEAFVKQAKNNELYVEIWPPYREPVVHDKGSPLENGPNQRIREVKETPYFLTGSLSTVFQVLSIPKEELMEDLFLEVLD